MHQLGDMLSRYWQQLAMTSGVFLATLGAALLARRYIFRALKRWADRTPGEFDNQLIEALRAPFLLWSLILAAHVATQVSALPAKATRITENVFLALWVLSLTLVASRTAAGIVRHYSMRASGGVHVNTLTQNVARMLVTVVGALILLNQLGVSIAPLLTALGVGGLAVALALQDTLSNLFAGIYITMAGQIRVGDYVKLDSGEEGYVTDITWHGTSIRALANNLILIPNAKLARANVTNYHLPERRMSLLIPIGVSYDSDPEEIERILVEEAKRGAETISGLLAEPEPFVRFIPGYGDSSLNFTLICQVKEFVDQYGVQHELRKRIFRRFRQEGIEIPFPMRTIVFKNDGEAAQAMRSTPALPSRWSKE